MCREKLLALFFFALTVSFLFVAPVFAECDSCFAPDCSPCGCKVSTDGRTCVYPNFVSDNITCGEITVPKMIPTITRTIVLIIQILVPILLVVFGMIDLLKSIIAHKEDEIKKGQQVLIKRLIVSVMIFSMVFIVKFIISAVANDNSSDMMDCVDCFISGDCD